MPFGNSRLFQIAFAIISLTCALNLVHDIGLFSTTPTMNPPNTAGITVQNNVQGQGDVLNTVSYLAGGLLWNLVLFIVSIPFPFVLLTQMGVPLVLAIEINGGIYGVLVAVGLTEMVLGRDVLT